MESSFTRSRQVTRTIPLLVAGGWLVGATSSVQGDGAPLTTFGR